MNRRCVLFVVLITVCCSAFAQTSALRDYVGLINQTYHPDIVSYFEKTRADLDKKGESDAAKGIELFLQGATGSGFVISDASGINYVVTNYHVIAQSYTLSITFERQDGFKKTYSGLKIIAADEETDLALLAFAQNDKPVDRGLAFLARPVEEGEDVYSAGFPGMGITTLWQFGRGMVSNAIARFPKSISDETLMGPFIQHTAQVDPGNSGGPLLVPQQNVPAGYAVAGVNTLSALWRQAANYAIPVNTTREFINAALNPASETWRAALDKRLSEFTGGLGANRAVYPHIAGFLSSACVGENAEYAMSELLEKAPRTVRQSFIDKCEDSVVGAMGYAVAWTIESNMRGQGAIKAAVKEISGSGEDYTVVFTINGKDISSGWIREYGAWRIRTFGEFAAGNKDFVAEKETKQKNKAALRTDSDFTVEAGYAYLFDKAPAALYVSIEYLRYMGAQAYFAGPDFWTIGAFIGYRGEFFPGNIGLMPYFFGGFDYQSDKDYEKFMDESGEPKGFPLAVMLKAGLKVTTAKVPGLFGGIGFQYNIMNLGFDDYDNRMKMALTITAGYAF
ncbi:MAG: trypsin-like peptidase domain-containing protein [Treponema sp.]|jgi:serine protease Do|nr:trypsin-like peptidase domain-containing protein [Treponema sp.]